MLYPVVWVGADIYRRSAISKEEHCCYIICVPAQIHPVGVQKIHKSPPSTPYNPKPPTPTEITSPISELDESRDTLGEVSSGRDREPVYWVDFFFVVSTITCPRTGSVHKVARRLMNSKV